MKKFMLLNYGFEEPTPKVITAWGQWFESVSEHLVDGGNPFSHGREVTRNGSHDLPREATSLTGYCIVNAEDMDAAESLLENCPGLDPGSR